MNEIERVLEERARAYARPLAGPRTEETIDVVCFEVGGERFAIDAALVGRILPAPRTIALPGTPPYLVGVANVRGQLLPVFDLVRLLGIPATGAATQLIVVGRTGFDLGILAGAVTDIVPLAAATRGSETGERSIVQRVLPDGRAHIDGAALLDDPRLVIGSAAHSTGEEVHR